MRPQSIEVAPVVARGFAAAGALHVENRDDRFRDARRAAMAAGHLDERACELVYLLENLLDRALGPFVERIRCVAPRAAKIARGEPDEHARPAGIAGLALDGVEDFVDGQHAPRFGTRIPNPQSRL